MEASRSKVEDIIREMRTLLVERYGEDHIPKSLSPDEPLFSIGVGLSSLEAIEFLVLVEQHFGIRIQNLDRLLEDEPTLANFSQFILDHNPTFVPRNSLV